MLSEWWCVSHERWREMTSSFLWGWPVFLRVRGGGSSVHPTYFPKICTKYPSLSQGMAIASNIRSPAENE